MSLRFNFFIALGIAMYAFAVSMSRSTTIKPFSVNGALKFAIFLEDFQALMPVFGWLGGYTI